MSWTCAICTDSIVDPSTGGNCTHHFCFECLSGWSKTAGASCPICRVPILRVLRDSEFAQAIGVCSLGLSASTSSVQHGASAEEGFLTASSARTVSVAWPAGISIVEQDATGTLIVSALVKGNGADLAGIIIGDVLLAVNDAPVRRDHRAAVQLIERHGAMGSLTLQIQIASLADGRVSEGRHSSLCKLDFSASSHTRSPMKEASVRSGVRGLHEQLLRPRSARNRQRERPFLSARERQGEPRSHASDADNSDDERERVRESEDAAHEGVVSGLRSLLLRSESPVDLCWVRRPPVL